jgi:hypothetical protein
MTIQTIFLVLIALMVPAFFALLFVTSAYHRLAALRSRCAQILAEAQGTTDSTNLTRLRQNHKEALADYARARLRFPGSAVASLFIRAPEPWPAQGRSGSPGEKN